MVQLKVSFRRNTDNHGQKLLNDLSDAFRHNYSDDTIVDLVNGGRLTGDELKLKHRINVEFQDGVLRKNTLYSSMTDWLIELFVD
jgi:hypothetical protein